MHIPLVDLKIQYESIRREIAEAVDGVLQRTDFILGSEVASLEQEVARSCGTRFAVGVASGTDALVLSLLALGIGKGDEVITTPFTFIATAEAISRVGATPVFCDIDPATLNIDPRAIERAVSPLTKAIVPVHLYGMPCAMDEILAVARSHKLKVIEDCAQAFGAEYKGRRTGSMGDAGCHSFFPGKNLGAYGDGGMIVTDREDVARTLTMLRNHGSTNKYYYVMHGFNSRLDTMQAAIVRVKMRHIDAWIEMRRRAARAYDQALARSLSVEPLCIPADGLNHSYNYYTVRVKKDRDTIQKHLKDNGIASAVYYPLCLHQQQVYKELGYGPGDFPVAEEAQSKVLSLPMYPELTAAEIQAIAQFL